MTSRFVQLMFGVALVAAVAAACSDGEADDAPALPDTSGAAVWSFLQDVDYQESWELWPGKGELYEASEPHGALLTTYLNAAAFEALEDRAGELPDGAVIVKENYTPEAVLDAITVMYKVDGYNGEHRDWFFAKLGVDGEVQAEGRVQGCQDCHGAAADNDYILTAPLR